MPRLRLTLLLIASLAAGPAHAAPPDAGTDPIAAAREAIAKGDALVARGQLVPACRRYELAVGLAPEWWYPAYKKALCDMSQGRYRDAFYLLSKARASRTELYVMHLAMARVLRALGEVEIARREYEQAIAVTRGAAEPMLELADLLLAAGHRGEARLVLKRAEYFRPTNLAVRMRLAGVSEALGLLADAESQLRYLAQRGANWRRNLALLAQFYQRHGHADRARAVTRLLASPSGGRDRELPAPVGEFASQNAADGP